MASSDDGDEDAFFSDFSDESNDDQGTDEECEIGRGNIEQFGLFMVSEELQLGTGWGCGRRQGFV